MFDKYIILDYSFFCAAVTPNDARICITLSVMAGSA
jgi:hypothetical protein